MSPEASGPNVRVSAETSDDLELLDSSGRTFSLVYVVALIRSHQTGHTTPAIRSLEAETIELEIHEYSSTKCGR